MYIKTLTRLRTHIMNLMNIYKDQPAHEVMVLLIYRRGYYKPSASMKYDHDPQFISFTTYMNNEMKKRGSQFVSFNKIRQ